MRLNSDSVIRYRRKSSCYLQSRDANFITDGHRRERVAIPPLRSAYNAAGFSRQFDAGRLTKTKFLNVIVEAFLPDAHASFDSADIARMSERLCICNAADRMRVAKLVLCDLDRSVAAVDHP